MLFAASAASACFFTSKGTCCSQKRNVRLPDSNWAYAAGAPQLSQRPTWVFTAFIAKLAFPQSFLTLYYIIDGKGYGVSTIGDLVWKAKALSYVRPAAILEKTSADSQRINVLLR
jgi:hypothetical protein